METYKITKTGQFGNLIKSISELKSRGRLTSVKDLEIITMRHDYLIVKSNDYGYTFLRLRFGKPYYNIEKVNENI